MFPVIPTVRTNAGREVSEMSRIASLSDVLPFTPLAEETARTLPSAAIVCALKFVSVVHAVLLSCDGAVVSDGNEPGTLNAGDSSGNRFESRALIVNVSPVLP